MNYAVATQIPNFNTKQRSVNVSKFELVNPLVEVSESISRNWKLILESECISLLHECSERGWNGYDAEPLSVQAVASAMIFIKSIPEVIAVPELSPSPDGYVTFEWENNKNIFSATIYDDTIVYAQLIGEDNKQHGEIPLSREMSDEIHSTLFRFFSK